MTLGSAPAIGSVFHPTDFTSASHHAFNHALKIALQNRSYFDILHVGANGKGAPDWVDMPQVRKTLEAWDLLEKGSPRTAVADKLGIKVRKVELRSRSPRTAISEFLAVEPTDLIVLATHGREGAPRWLKPSVSEPLARDARTATLFLPDGARGFVTPEGEVRLNRVLVPVDRKPAPQPAVDVTAGFLHRIGVQAPRVEALFVGPSEQMPEITAPASLGDSFQSTARPGNPVEEILRSAEEADLIVMATEGHNGILDALRGSTTEQVLRRAPCAVLAIPSRTS